jgi:hypothetical protein
MAFDQHRNFSFSTVAVAPVPALTGLSLTVAAGHGALFTAPCNCTVWPTGTSPVSTNAEIVRVTNVAGDVLTILRAQEGSTARAIVAGDQIANTSTVKVFTDIENAIQTSATISNGNGAPVAPPANAAAANIYYDDLVGSPSFGNSWVWSVSTQQWV